MKLEIYSKARIKKLWSMRYDFNAKSEIKYHIDFLKALKKAKGVKND